METRSGTLIQAWGVQRRVVFAILMREILTRYGRHNIGFVWLFIEPMMFTLGVMALWSYMKLLHSSFPIAAFALTGYSSILLWRNMPNRCIGALEPNLQLMYHRNVTVLDIYSARILLEAFGASASFLILSIIFIAIGAISPPEDLLTVLIGWGLLALFGAALALFLGSLGEKYETVERVWHVCTYLLFPLSGAGFNVNALPPEGQKIILALPMVHGVELVREGYFGSAFRAHYSITYMVIWIVLLMLGGLIMIAALQKNRTAE